MSGGGERERERKKERKKDEINRLGHIALTLHFTSLCAMMSSNIRLSIKAVQGSACFDVLLLATASTGRGSHSSDPIGHNLNRKRHSQLNQAPFNAAAAAAANGLTNTRHKGPLLWARMDSDATQAALWDWLGYMSAQTRLVA